jgi:hypothetical protein
LTGLAVPGRFEIVKQFYLFGSRSERLIVHGPELTLPILVTVPWDRGNQEALRLVFEIKPN